MCFLLLSTICQSNSENRFMQPFCFQLPYGQKEINFVTTQYHHFAMSWSIQMIYIYMYINPWVSLWKTVWLTWVRISFRIRKTNVKQWNKWHNHNPDSGHEQEPETRSLGAQCSLRGRGELEILNLGDGKKRRRVGWGEENRERGYLVVYNSCTCFSSPTLLANL